GFITDEEMEPPMPAVERQTRQGRKIQLPAKLREVDEGNTVEKDPGNSGKDKTANLHGMRGGCDRERKWSDAYSTPRRARVCTALSLGCNASGTLTIVDEKHVGLAMLRAAEMLTGVALRVVAASERAWVMVPRTAPLSQVEREPDDRTMALLIVRGSGA
ncbi:hypothetical protein BD410DRAFT_810215, partial [Rickenella mellea]